MLTKQDRKYIDQKIEDLAIMIQKGFQELNTNKVDKTDIDRLETRMEGLETRMDCLDTRMYSLEGKVNTLEFRLITAPDNRIDKVEDDIRIIKSKIGLA